MPRLEGAWVPARVQRAHGVAWAVIAPNGGYVWLSCHDDWSYEQCQIRARRITKILNRIYYGSEQAPS